MTRLLCRLFEIFLRSFSHASFRFAAVVGLLGAACVSCTAFHPSGARVLAARAASRADCQPAVARRLAEMSKQLVLMGTTRGNARAGTFAAIGGTAFPVTRDGYHLTAAHCVQNSDLPFQVVFRESAKGPTAFDFARVVWISRKDDLALLHTPRFRSDDPFQLADPRTCRVGAPVHALGLAEKYLGPAPWETACSGRVTKSTLRPLWPLGATAPAVVHTAPVWFGDSGGPLLDAKCRVVGVHSMAEIMGTGGRARCPDPTLVADIIAKDRKARRNRPQRTLLRPPPAGPRR